MSLKDPKRPIVPRGKLWKRQRGFVLARDRQCCQYCGAGPLPSKGAHLDHIRPLKAGGEDALWNYVTACDLCNKTKSGRWPADGEPDLVVGQHGIRALYASRRAAFAALQTAGGLAPGAAAPGGPAPVTDDPIALLSELLPAMIRKIAIRDASGAIVDLAVVPDFRDVLAILNLRGELKARATRRKRGGGVAFLK